MSRLSIVTRDNSPTASKPLLDLVYKKLGTVPNFSRLVGMSPGVLRAFAAFQEGLAKALDAKMRARIALAIAEHNGCDYCLSANSYFATNFAKLPPEEIALNRQGRSNDPKAEAAVRFAVSVAYARGHVDDLDIKAVKLAGFDEAQIIEIVALVVENIFANYLNEVAKTDIDFPVVRSAPRGGI